VSFVSIVWTIIVDSEHSVIKMFDGKLTDNRVIAIIITLSQ